MSTFPDIDRFSHQRQLAVLADFGHYALRCDDLDILLQEATALVAKGLATNHAKICELLPGGENLLLRAGVGWPPGIVGKHILGGGRQSGSGFALTTGLPVISEDLAHETRFQPAEITLDQKIRSSVNVVIQGNHQPFGVLEVDSTEFRKFTAEDVNFLQLYANVLSAAIERLQSNRRLTEVARDKEVLMRELQHRVKNDVQVISSLLMIEVANAQSEETRNRLGSLANRIDALRLMHQQLYVGTELGRLNLGAYLHDLCESRLRLHLGSPDSITLTLDLTDLPCSRDIATPVGLIVNELVTNSLKYAFPSGQGEISVTLEKLGKDKACLTIADNGIGKPDTAQCGSGLTLTRMLATQVNGELEWAAGPGTKAVLVFPAEEG